MAGKKFVPHSHKSMRKNNRPTIERSLEVIYWLEHERNSTKWKKLRKLVRSCHPMCAATGCTLGATSVHHVRSAVKYPDRFYDMANLVPLCWGCHADVSELEYSGHWVDAEELYTDKAAVIYKKFLENLLD